MIAIYNYVIDSDDVRARWKYKTDEYNKYYQCQINVFFKYHTIVMLKLSLVTRIFLVQGETLKNSMKANLEKTAKYINQLQDNTDTAPDEKSL